MTSEEMMALEEQIAALRSQTERRFQYLIDMRDDAARRIERLETIILGLLKSIERTCYHVGYDEDGSARGYWPMDNYYPRERLDRIEEELRNLRDGLWDGIKALEDARKTPPQEPTDE